MVRNNQQAWLVKLDTESMKDTELVIAGMTQVPLRLGIKARIFSPGKLIAFFFNLKMELALFNNS